MVALGSPPDPTVLEKQRHLRKGTGDYGSEISISFAIDFKRLAEGELDNWYDDTDGVLAIIIMFQFFAKYMFKEDKRAFQFEEDAIQISRYVVLETDFDKMYSDY